MPYNIKLMLINSTVMKLFEFYIKPVLVLILPEEDRIEFIKLLSQN